MNKKIFSLQNLKAKIEVIKNKNKKVVLCHGVFDLLHLGHIKHFEEAKKYGDILIATVTPDKYVAKGSGRPLFKLKDRLEALSALSCIDFVAENQWSNAINTIRLLKPNIYCKGPDYKNHKKDLSKKITDEQKAVLKVGGNIKYTSDKTIFSSSNIINKMNIIHSSDQKKIINKIKTKFKFEDIKKEIDEFRKLKVLIIGETIIDSYQFCESMGKSGKEPFLTMRESKEEYYLGGAGAVANHVSSFSNSVTLLSMLGEKKEFQGFVNKKMSNNIKKYFIYKKNSPTIVKKRIIEEMNNRKLLGVYNVNDEMLSKSNESTFLSKIKKLIPKNDLIIVLDYGHGFINKKIAKTISRLSKFVSLNAQVNSSNVGYHNMEKYNNIDCVIINETELRQEIRSKVLPVDFLMIKLIKKIGIKDLVVTQGNDGSRLYSYKNKKKYLCPAFATKIVDKVGAGDSMLSILSMCLKNKLDKELSMLISSLAAAETVETIGNSQKISKEKILKSLLYLLK